jgi:hypothetical protein
VPNGEQVTGVSDSRYSVVSVLYHSVQGGWTCAKYIEDAEREDDQELGRLLPRRAAGGCVAGPEGQRTTRQKVDPRSDHPTRCRAGTYAKALGSGPLGLYG